MDSNEVANLIASIFAIAIVGMVVAIPIIITVFTFGVIKKTTRFALKPVRSHNRK